MSPESRQPESKHPESQSGESRPEWQPESWQVDLESRIKLAQPIASPVERERILYEAAYQRGRRSMRLPSFLASVGSCAATLLIAWSSMALTQVTTLDESVLAEAKGPVSRTVAIPQETSRAPDIQSTEPRLPMHQQLSAVSLRGVKSSMPIEEWLRELDRSEESPTEISPNAEPSLRPRTNLDFL